MGNISRSKELNSYLSDNKVPSDSSFRKNEALAVKLNCLKKLFSKNQGINNSRTRSKGWKDHRTNPINEMYTGYLKYENNEEQKVALKVTKAKFSNNKLTERNIKSNVLESLFDKNLYRKDNKSKGRVRLKILESFRNIKY